MTVYLVGAGPGDPELVTVRAARLLARCDAVVHDRLATPVLELVPAHVPRFDVGKHVGGHGCEQAKISAMLVALGRAGLAVVRLKGGDPFVFGRGGEEALALTSAGVEWEVVPGVSAAIAAPALAGVPVTHRGIADVFTVITGHRTNGHESNWESLAGVGGTIVVLMGVAQRGEIARRLIAGGRDQDTAVAVIRNGTLPDQSVQRCRLDDLGALDVSPPATIVIGAVVDAVGEVLRR